MNIVITLCLVCLTALTVSVVVKLFASAADERLNFLKNFKKGKFALIYIIAIPLYYLAYRYTETAIGESIVKSIKSVVRLVVLNFEFDPVKPLMEADLYFRVVIDLCFVLVTLNALMFTFTLFGQNLINGIRSQRARRGGRKLYLLVGYNDRNGAIMKSVGRSEGGVLVCADLDQKQKDAVFVAGKSYLRFTARQDLGATIRRKFRVKGRSVRVIVNTGDDAANLIVVRQLADFLAGFAPEALAALDFHVYAFGEPENVSSFVRFVEATKGKVHYVNKYRLIAMDFVGRYPLTRFMTEEHLDYERGALLDDVDARCLLIGFGKTNHHIFLTSVANDQLYTDRDGYRAKAVEYWIYDKKDSQNDKNLNHNYNRYRRSLPYLQAERDAYFPLPPEPADLGAIDAEPGANHFVKMDINEPAFYCDVRARLLPKPGRKAFNYLVVAFASDLENYDLAEKLYAKLEEWGLVDCTRIFVKIRSAGLARKVMTPEHRVRPWFYVFGCENEIVYRADRIVREETEEMAQRRHLCYAAEAQNGARTAAEIRAAALEKWYGTWNQVQRESNIYACLSIRMKLNLLGYDYVPGESGLGDRAREFAARYAADDPIRYSGVEVEGRKVVDYGDCRFRSGTVRARLAEQEHQRWNAYMITSGYLPAKIEDVLHRDKQELMRVRQHGNLTTFAGLSEYRDLLARETGRSPAETDVIKYDYQLMDDAVWLLHSAGYVIVAKDEAEEYRRARGE